MDTKFKIDQYIVYPSQGVGKIMDVFERDFKGVPTMYYKIYIEASDILVMIPVEKAEELGIREVVSAEEAQAALNLLSDEFEPITSDWKLRYQMNLDLLKKGTVNDIAKIVRCLYNRSKVKELPILERKLYDSAKKLLEDEISLAMGLSAKEIAEMIHTKLEPPGAVQKVKHVISLDDEDDDDLMDDLNNSDEDDEEDSDTRKSSKSDSDDEDMSDDSDEDFEDDSF